MKIVSACLAGMKCKYDGSARPHQKVIDLVKQGKAIPICPEQLGGLPTPRPATEERKGKIVTKQGEDQTTQYIGCSKEAMKIVKLFGCREAILKTGSPTCGAGKVYSGTFSGKLIKKDGVFARLLKKNRIKVLTEEDL